LLKVLRANVRASSSYDPKPYQGQLTLFQTGRNVPNATWGWGDIAAGEIERHRIAGNHMNLLRSPHVAALAEALSACLTRLKTGIDDGRP
jgi:thioesterase domain-containing protein